MTSSNTYNGRPCKHCGNCVKFVYNKTCIICSKRRKKEFNARHRERLAAAARLYRKNKPKEVRTKERGAAKYPMPTRPEPDLCEMCGGPPSSKKAIHLDHCHTTGKFRGWLCHKCNMGLGLLGDSICGAVDRLLAYRNVADVKD